MRRALPGLALLLMAAGPPPPGASSCTGCHGPTPQIPSLAGRSATEMLTALNGFRTGKRPATVMDRIAKGFTEAELSTIAAWWEDRK